MRITIDTEKNKIIVPDTFFAQIDKINANLASVGSEKKVDYTEYVKDAFAKAIAEPIVRKSDI